MRLPKNTLEVTLVLLIAIGLQGLSRAAAQNLFLPDAERSKEPVPKVQKLDFAYRASEAYLAGGTGFDMMTTVHGLDHPTTAWSASGIFLTHYYVRESGWARITGTRDVAGVVFANVALNAGIDLLDQKLYRRGGRWRIAAVGLNVLKGTGNIVDGFHNIHVYKGVDGDVQRQTGYRGAISWSW